MCALPAWRIASSALCATLLVGIAGPAAMAADSAREPSHAASPGARLPDRDARLAQLRALDGGELAPLVDLLHGVLKANNGQLTAAEARKLATAAKQALAEMAAVRTDTATPTASAPATLLPLAPVGGAADSTDDALDTLESVLDEVEQAVDDLLKAFDSVDEASEDESVVLPSADDLLTELDDLIDALTDNDPSEPTLAEPTTLPSLWPLTSAPSLSPVTLPAITSALLDS
ncbi:hypothetical protein ABZ935_09355 [Streptomyces coeruleorubidus]|jgi:hypothetical protein|uniref:hypothetical protein n=1 Tax=Streptomyces coeruleorubidus TaxID=116188 RepID=UPI0033FEF606